MKTSNALVGIAVTSGLGLFAWFWSIPQSESMVEMFTGRPSKPGSWLHRSIRFSRWFGVVFCGFIVVLIVFHWTGLVTSPN